MSGTEFSASDIQSTNWYGLKPAVAKLLTARAINPLLRLAARTVLPPSIGHRLPLNRRSVTYRLEGARSFELLDPLHDIVARDIYWGAGRATDAAERHKLAAIERLCADADLFVDIGAYAGLCSLIAARSNPRIKVVAYELVPENFLLLVRNVVENDLLQVIDARLRGLGERHTTLKLPPRFGAASYLTSISLGSSFEGGASIPIVPLDDDLEVKTERILMKIDVEGFEDKVLAGARELIRKRCPDIICEVLPNAKAATNAIAALLAPLGYRWYCFEDDGLQARQQLEPGGRMRDWLLSCDQQPVIP